MTLMKRLYGIVFVAGAEGVTLEQCAQTFNEPVETIRETMVALQLMIQQNDTLPYDLVKINETYRLMTRAELAPDIEQFAQAPLNQTLSRAAIETLAIIAYRQPITRVGIDTIRGVSSVTMLQKLMARQLIKEIGRLEAPGRPVLYGVSEYFMEYFGLHSLDDLPALMPLSLNDELASDALFNLKEWQIDMEEA